MPEITAPVEPAVARQNGIFDYTQWQGKLPQLSRQYGSASPYPHIVLDNFLQPEAIEKLWEEFPRVTDAGWIHYLHVNDK